MMTQNASTVNGDITSLLKARHTLLWITTREERRVELALVGAASAATYNVCMWDCATGLTDSAGNKVGSANINDPGAMLDYIRNTKQRMVYVLRDLGSTNGLYVPAVGWTAFWLLGWLWGLPDAGRNDRDKPLQPA